MHFQPDWYITRIFVLYLKDITDTTVRQEHTIEVNLSRSRSIFIFGLVALLANCSQSAGLNSGESRKTVQTSSSGNGEQTATVETDSTETQTVVTDAESDLKGVEIEIPPDALDASASDGSITIQEGATVANDVTGSYLTDGLKVSPLSKSVFLGVGSTNAPFKKEIKLTLPVLPEHSEGLAGNTLALAVFYVTKNNGTFIVGAVNQENVSTSGGALQVSIKAPGTYQAGIISSPLASSLEKESFPRPMTKIEETSPLPVAAFQEYMAGLISLDPAGTYPQAPHVPLFDAIHLDSDFTISFRILTDGNQRIEPNVPGPWNYIIDKRVATLKRGFRCRQNPDAGNEVIKCLLADEGDTATDTAQITSKNPVGRGATADHVTFVKSGRGISLFINGVFDGFKVIDANILNISPDGPFYFGTQQNGKYLWTGKFGRFKFWQVGLTDTQIIQDSIP